MKSGARVVVAAGLPKRDAALVVPLTLVSYCAVTHVASELVQTGPLVWIGALKLCSLKRLPLLRATVVKALKVDTVKRLWFYRRMFRSR